MSDFVSSLADQILAMLNASPRMPSKEELAKTIQLIIDDHALAAFPSVLAEKQCLVHAPECDCASRAYRQACTDRLFEYAELYRGADGVIKSKPVSASDVGALRKAQNASPLIDRLIAEASEAAKKS